MVLRPSEHLIAFFIVSESHIALLDGLTGYCMLDQVVVLLVQRKFRDKGRLSFAQLGVALASEFLGKISVQILALIPDFPKFSRVVSSFWNRGSSPCVSPKGVSS